MTDILILENILFLLFSIGFWPTVYIFAKKYNNNRAIIKNYIHFLHAILFVALYKNLDHSILSYPIIFSLGFYICDMVYIFYNIAKGDNYNKHLPYIIHHIIANNGLYMALTQYLRQEIMYFYYLLEYSNFLLYISYHIQKTYRNHTILILVSECFQFVWYSYFRIIRFLIYWYKVKSLYFDAYFFIQLGVIILFYMGAFWSFKLFKKCLNGLHIGTIQPNEPTELSEPMESTEPTEPTEPTEHNDLKLD